MDREKLAEIISDAIDAQLSEWEERDRGEYSPCYPLIHDPEPRFLAAADAVIEAYKQEKVG